MLMLLPLFDPRLLRPGGGAIDAPPPRLFGFCCDLELVLLLDPCLGELTGLPLGEPFRLLLLLEEKPPLVMRPGEPGAEYSLGGTTPPLCWVEGSMKQEEEEEGKRKKKKKEKKKHTQEQTAESEKKKKNLGKGDHLEKQPPFVPEQVAVVKIHFLIEVAWLPVSN